MNRRQSLAVRFFYSSVARTMFTNAWYALVSQIDRDAEVTLMNYGYASADGGRIVLGAEYEAERYAIQLYDHVVDGVALKGRDVLEVGCGRGGGAAYISRTFHPRAMVGLDRTAASIRFARRHFASCANLRFIEGDAHALPFDDNSFDAVVNVESAQHYRDMDRFLGEAHRVLRPGGHFLIACFEDAGKGVFPRAALERSKLRLRREEDITPGVVRAMDMDSVRKRRLARRLVPAFLGRVADEFAGIAGSELYESFASGKCPYYLFVCRKD
jgi:ubiquinone/menaquinone biosynthesis C-methylase UbiE